MYLKVLREMNPWWSHEEWESRDKNLVDYGSLKVKWIPKWIDEISLEPFSLNFVLGLRQVGKTTGLKLLIRKLVENENENVVYMTVMLFPTLSALERL